ncbi:Polyketide cyclase / dehydrase and lipid transport [Prosthecobacter debontii]|uniref:Polyketide cyclase / dehydrase and lipid transport n=1 Tax=Prosthecobacter debontii TaxID=48467 RepID=A0A1T4Z2G2_9BACT|nr:SRPBCC family protein [Prosthecobacter debontii]SKB07741.1 Polyketide cyclase / dehydrase and lipid transport [Prosthecobacter debontii]
MFKKILIVLALAIIALVVVIQRQPDEFTVTRSTVMDASPQAVYEQVNDLHQWQDWSPWAKLDPQATATFTGPATGEGSSFAWSGNNEVGEGKQTIVESRPGELVRFKLEFIRPFAGTNDVDFTFKPEGTGTRVTWTMSGKANFISKTMGLVMDCDKMCGDFFVQGLANLKAIVETAPKA